MYASCSASLPPHATLASRRPATALPGPDLHRLSAPAFLAPSLVSTTVRVLIRDDLHPQIVSLLLLTMIKEHGGRGVLQRAGEFPTQTDPEYPMAASVTDFYKNGPSLLQRHLPLWLTVHVQRAIAVLVAAIAIGIPLFNFAPRLYLWFVNCIAASGLLKKHRKPN